MSSMPVQLLTPQEYLERERKAEFRSEFYRGEMFAMAGASWEHTSVKDNLSQFLGPLFRDGPCRVRTGDLRVKVDLTGLYTYPDIVIICEKPQFEDKVFDTLLNPRVVIEVLSDSTEAYDRGAKFRHYQQIATLQEYVLVAQDQPLMDRYVRQPDNSWLLTTVSDISMTFEFASVPARLPLVEVYRDVTFPETPLR